MTIDFIKIDQSITTAKFAGELAELVSRIRAALEKLDRVKDIMDHSNDGTDFTQIEAFFGLATGKGQTVYDLVNGTFLALTGAAQNANSVSLTERVG